MGFTETVLQEHITNDHSDTSFEVVRLIDYYIYLFSKEQSYKTKIGLTVISFT